MRSVSSFVVLPASELTYIELHPEQFPPSWIGESTRTLEALRFVDFDVAVIPAQVVHTAGQAESGKRCMERGGTGVGVATEPNLLLLFHNPVNAAGQTGGFNFKGE